MKTEAAVLHGVGAKWQVEEVTLAEPTGHEVLVEIKAAGLCHSEHHMVTGDMVRPEEIRAAAGRPKQFPLLGGHEGAGVVIEVGSEVQRLAPGDHVTTSFTPSCGICRYCATGRQYICDAGHDLMSAKQQARHHLGDQPLNVYSNLGTFARHALVHEYSLIPVEPDIPFEAACLVSCGVPTGWGSAVTRGGTRPGDIVAVIGTGGIGINAVQGAAAAGARAIIAIDPAPRKRDWAMELGATHSAPSIDDARDLITELSRGRNCELVVVSSGVLYGEILGDALSIVGKGGTCVATAIAPSDQQLVPLNLQELTLWNKELKGTIFGSINPRSEVPNLLELYRAGRLKLDELVTHRFRLDELNDGYDELLKGNVLRGVMIP
jgi:S-(hydroxymethyl)glutathione dehydrogenase/alcohol dehydrogenase